MARSKQARREVVKRDGLRADVEPGGHGPADDQHHLAAGLGDRGLRGADGVPNLDDLAVQRRIGDVQLLYDHVVAGVFEDPQAEQVAEAAPNYRSTRMAAIGPAED